MSKYHEEYIDKPVQIKRNSKKYQKDMLVGKYGVIARTSGSLFGVLVDGRHNRASSYGVYWFDRSEINFLNNESEDIKMEGYKYVAIVNLKED